MKYAWHQFRMLIAELLIGAALDIMPDGESKTIFAEAVIQYFTKRKL